MTDPVDEGMTKTAVITGHHPYDVAALHALFRALPRIDPYPQNLEDFVTDTGKGRSNYDAVVFYNFHQPTPDGGEYPMGGDSRPALETLLGSGQGIVVLHHAVLAYPEWEAWQRLVGGIRIDTGKPVLQDQTVRVENVAPDHPITLGLANWEIIDEPYCASEPQEGSQVLLTTDHPVSMRSLAWTRENAGTRVFCYQSGHDEAAFNNPSFRMVLERGILWTARRL